ncbi:MAG TPA: hypothetical protein VFV34_15320, partial [Blastocatellia bacterium]|nr:hypothetical protein [Blastocatellia bacterium]
MNDTQRRPGSSSALILPGMGWLLLFFAGPLIIIIVISFATRGPYGKIIYDFTAGNYASAFDRLYIPAFWRTLWIATATTALSIVVSYPVAYYIALRASERWKRILLMLTVVPFWTSFLIRTYAWVLLLRTEGVINTVLVKTALIAEP